MILVTVGTQLAFDRLVGAIDDWAADQSEEVVAQVGPSQLHIKHLKAQPFVSASEMEVLFSRARIIVAHAGMGSILSALKHRKPIIIVPRKASMGEHRNEHQLATARWMQNRPGVRVAWEPNEALALLEFGVALQTDIDLPQFAQPAFVARLRKWMAE